MNPEESDLQSLLLLVRDLAARVERLEHRIGVGEDTRARVETRDIKETPLVSPQSETPVHTPPPQTPRPPLSFAPHAVEGRPEIDLENRIGSHWLNRIGISAVLIGMSYFLKFAFDNNWIGPTGRVSIGLLAGIAVVVWSESFRRRGYIVFSYSLKAVGALEFCISHSGRPSRFMD